MADVLPDFRDLMDSEEARSYRDIISYTLGKLEDGGVNAFAEHTRLHSEDCEPTECDWCHFRIVIDRRSNAGD